MIVIMFNDEMKENNINENYMMKSENKLIDMSEINSDTLKINFPIKVKENKERYSKYFNHTYQNKTEKSYESMNFFNRSVSNLPRKLSDFLNIKQNSGPDEISELKFLKNNQEMPSTENRITKFTPSENYKKLLNSNINKPDADILIIKNNKLSNSQDSLNDKDSKLSLFKSINDKSTTALNSTLNNRNLYLVDLYKRLNDKYKESEDFLNQETGKSNMITESKKVNCGKYVINHEINLSLEKTKNINNISLERLNVTPVRNNIKTQTKNNFDNKTTLYRTPIKKLTHKKSQIKYSKEEAIKISLNIYQKGLENKKVKEENLKLIRDEKNRINYSFTFQPNFEKSRKSLIFSFNSGFKVNNKMRNNSYSDLTWLKNRDNMLDKMRKLAEEKELSECTFSPNIHKNIMEDDLQIISLNRDSSIEYINKLRNHRNMKIKDEYHNNNKHCMCHRIVAGNRKIIISDVNSNVDKPSKNSFINCRSLSARDVLKTRKSLDVEDFFTENSENKSLNLNKNFTDEEVKLAFENLKKICT